MGSSHMGRPLSLLGSVERLRECMEASGEGMDDWAEVLGIDPASLRLKLAKGGECSARQLLAVDDISGGAFLNPNERYWCKQAVKLADRQKSRQYYEVAA